MRFRVVSLTLTFVVIAASAAGQTIGNYVLAPNSTTAPIARPFTVLDLNSPATAAGTIGAVVIRSNQPCTGAFKVKFFHQSGGTYTPFADRGPFDITHALVVVTLTPPVNVVAGDLIGLVALQDCTGLIGQVPLLFKNAAQFNGDVASPVTLGSAVTLLPNFALAALGAANTNSEVRTQTIPAAGAAEGAFGASFKTDLFLSNPRSTRAAGRLVYHPEETSGTADDPSFPFIVDSRTSLNFTNFVKEKIGLTGKGSIDVYTIIGYEAPNVASRIYDDSPAGTKGFTLEALTERDALQTLENAVLVTPRDPSKYRMNIGVRTLNGPTQIEFDLFDSGGGVRATVTNNYPANYYKQTDFHSLFGVDPQAGNTINVVMRQGSGYVYGSIIDNTSNDPSAQVAKPLK